MFLPLRLRALGLASASLTLSHAAPPPKVRLDPDLQKVERTRLELAKGYLTPKSRVALEKAVTSPRSDLSLDAVAKLDWAVKIGKYPRSKLLLLIETRTVASKSWWGVVYAGDYARALGLKVVGDKALDRSALFLTGEHESSSVLSTSDRQYFELALKSDSVSGRVDSLYAIFPKRQLPKASTEWVKARLNRELANRTSPEREFWQYAARVFQARNILQTVNHRPKK